MRDCDIKFVNKEITPFGGLSLFFKMLEKCHFEEHVMQSGVPLQPKSVIRISLCRTTQRNPNDRFGFKSSHIPISHLKCPVFTFPSHIKFFPFYPFTFLPLYIFLERLNVFFKGFNTFGGELAGGSGALSLKTLLHFDVTGGGKLVYLHTQIARRGAGLFTKIDEIGLVYAHQQRHHG